MGEKFENTKVDKQKDFEIQLGRYRDNLSLLSETVGMIHEFSGRLKRYDTPPNKEGKDSERSPSSVIEVLAYCNMDLETLISRIQTIEAHMSQMI